MKLKFKYYSEKEIEKLLSSPLSDKIKSIKVKQWFNLKTKAFFYGLDVIGESGNVCGLCEGNRAVIFEDKAVANKACRTLRKQLKAVSA